MAKDRKAKGDTRFKYQNVQVPKGMCETGCGSPAEVHGYAQSCFDKRTHEVDLCWSCAYLGSTVTIQQSNLPAPDVWIDKLLGAPDTTGRVKPRPGLSTIEGNPSS